MQSMPELLALAEEELGAADGGIGLDVVPEGREALLAALLEHHAPKRRFNGRRAFGGGKRLLACEDAAAGGAGAGLVVVDGRSAVRAVHGKSPWGR